MSVFEVGGTIATYRLTGVIGGGGMGAVYRAYDERLQRDVALKLLSPQLSADPSFRARFEREARTAGALRHPNIVPVFDAGEWHGQLYLAMMLVEGPNLAKVIERDAPLALRRVAAIVAQVAGALDAAHAQGIIHRDVKPANVLLLEHAASDGADYAYLADFGLTRSTSAMTQMTRVGTFLGTLAYIAPEQLHGDHIDGRADQYALACTAFEMLTAAPPFKRDSEVALISAHLYTPPPLLADVRPDLPAALGSVLARAMAKDPAARFPAAGDFAQALSQATFGAASGPPTIARRASSPLPAQGIVRGRPADAAPRRSASPLPLAAALIALAAVVGVAGYVVTANLAQQLGKSSSPLGTPPQAQDSTVAVGAAAPPSMAPNNTTVPPTRAVPQPSYDLTPPPAITPVPTVPEVTPPPVAWTIRIVPSATTLYMGQQVTIDAFTNADVGSYGYVIRIANSSGKVFAVCYSGSTCEAKGAPVRLPTVSYVVTVGPRVGPPAAQDSTVVAWLPLPVTPAPPPTGPVLAAGLWNMMYTFESLDYGVTSYQAPNRTYEVVSQGGCVSGGDCVVFLVDGASDVTFIWSGNTLIYDTAGFNEGRACNTGKYTIREHIEVSPVAWDGVTPISHLQGSMTLSAYNGPAGCDDWHETYAADLSAAQ